MRNNFNTMKQLILAYWIGTKGSATVNFDRSFWALSKREDSRSCASAQGRDGKEDEGCEGEGRSTLRGGLEKSADGGVDFAFASVL